MRFTFIGCGDAFASGGRFNTCFHVSAASADVLIDCGASSLVALKRAAVDVDKIAAIFVTHFHGDHFGGVPYFVLDAQFSKRTRPLTIAGPEGLRDWFERAMETTFPGSSRAQRKFETRLLEIAPGVPVEVCGIEAVAARVRHGPVEGPFLAYRLRVDERTIAYTGDTEWTDSLIELGREADLMIAEGYFVDKKVPLHLDIATLRAKLPLIRPKRLILTHMSQDVLSRLAEIELECAADGMVVEL